MDLNEYMEVDDETLPNLECIKELPESKANLAPAPPFSTAPTPRQISFFPIKPEPIVRPPLQLSIRRQQTNEPTCPSEFSPPAAHSVTGNNSGACAPGLDGFEYFPHTDTPGIPCLSADDVDTVLNPLAHMTPFDSYPPSVPDLPDANALHLFIPGMIPRERLSTISLLRETDAPETEDCLFGDDQQEIMHELMDNACDDAMSTDQCYHIPIPSACEASSREHWQYDDVASYTLEMHKHLAQDVPHAKKKPMLHEFLGYILFCRDEQLSVLLDSIYFCRKNGDRVQPQRPKKHFRVANFQAVSEVWKRIKCNSSKDCTKNMKRAMRMSTTNERNYFVNLSQRMHRLQVFKFGDRSVEIFKRVFSDWYRC